MQTSESVGSHIKLTLPSQLSRSLCNVRVHVRIEQVIVRGDSQRLSGPDNDIVWHKYGI